MTASTEIGPDLREPLARAARYRFLSLLLRPVSPGRGESLRALAREVPRGDGPDPESLAVGSDEEAMEQGFRLLGQAGPVSCLASDYVGAGYADKGPILADLSGFYRAFGFIVNLAEPVDHFATIFEFLSFLAMKESWHLTMGGAEQMELARDAGRKLLDEHVLSRLPLFAERFALLVPPGSLYEGVAEFVLASFAAELGTPG